MRSFSILACVLAFIAMFCIASAASADTVTIFQDGFEGYTAATTFLDVNQDVDPGTPPSFGDPWTVAESSPYYVQVMNVPHGTAYCAGPHSGVNYLNIFHAGQIAFANIPTAGQNLIQQNANVSLDMWVYKNLADGWTGGTMVGGRTGAVDPFAVSFGPDGKVYYNGMNDTGLTFTSDTWMNLKVDVDFASQTFDVTLNGNTAKNLGFDQTASKLESVYLYAAGYWGSDSRGAFDDVTISVSEVPEPGTLTLVVCGLLGLLAYAWRKHK
jgi:hypothetical protein